MASGQTQYYGLSQWEAADKVERVDFNSDNAKIDGALHALAEQVQPLVRAVPQLAYYIGQLAILDLLDRGQYLGQRAMLYEAFLHPEDLTLSGSAEIRAGVLCLEAPEESPHFLCLWAAPIGRRPGCGYISAAARSSPG